ncbi:hypothetical protein BBJ28_00023555 [Nothophytophthora sp. Chile5]|nr:hypothetical protein BBJ28_00023555 [Nothophytophthora sp. Chile5]
MMKPTSSRAIERGLWSGDEHDRFLDGLKLYPRGPWKKIAGHVGTRSPRQVQTHAQKYYEKVGRRLRGLRKDRKKLVRPEHRLDEDMVQLCQLAKNKTDSSDVDSALAERLRAPLSSPAKVSISLVALASPTKQSFQQQLQEAQLTDVKLGLKSEPLIEVTWNVPASPCPSSSCGSTSTDSELAMDLSDFDDSCLDFLIEVLGASNSEDMAIDL